MKKFLQNILLTLITCFICFIIVEAGFKILHLLMTAELYPTEIEGLPYELTPNGWFIRYEPVNGWVKYRNNSLGIRDVERTFEKPKGVKRIVCLGDSVMYGGEVAFDDIFSQRLENKLNASYPFKVEVINCGISSYSLEEYPIYLRNKGIKFDPDIVIVGLCLNDYTSLFRDNPIQEGTGRTKTANKNLKEEGKFETYFRKLKRFLLHSYFIEYIQKALTTLKKPKDDFQGPEHIEMLQEKSWKKNSIYIEELKTICRENNATLIFVIFPVGQQFSYLKDNDMPQSYIKKLLNSYRIPCVDIRHDFEKSIEGGETLFTPHDNVHFLPKGHLIAATAVADKIGELNLLLTTGPQLPDKSEKADCRSTRS